MIRQGEVDYNHGAAANQFALVCQDPNVWMGTMKHDAGNYDSKPISGW